MIAALTGAGLAAAAGLNAFIPLVIVGLFARFTEFIVLPDHLTWLESWPVIIVSLLLLTLELVLDKIPGVDHINDLLQTIIRPVVGGILFAATAASQVVDQSNFWQDNPLVAGIVGALVTLAVHLGKAASRPAVNATTGGTGAPLASFAEDAIAVVLCLVAIFVPVLVVFVFIFMAIAVYRIVTTGRRRRRHREMLQSQERAARDAAEAEGGVVAWWRSKWREPRSNGSSGLSLRLSRSASGASAASATSATSAASADTGATAGSGASAGSAVTPLSDESPRSAASPKD